MTPRLVVLGTGDFALPTFELLCETGQRVVGLITQPDRPQGRKQELIPSRIKEYARARGIEVAQPENVNAAESLAFVRAWQPELLVVAAYGQILSAELLGIPPLGGINLHGSILPAYRGAAPVARAIQNGEHETGVTVIRMTPRVDAGGILSIARTPIDPDETAGQLEARLARIGAPLVVEAIEAVAAGTAEVLRQEKTRVTRAAKLSKEDGRIDWTKPAQAVHNLVRAMQPWPTAYTVWNPSDAAKQPIRLIVHQTAVADGEGTPSHVLDAEADRLIVAAGQGSVRLVTVQVAGKKPMPVVEFLRGHHVWPGDRMGDVAPGRED
jgi:methionyl-tRNA formyltransferase